MLALGASHPSLSRNVAMLWQPSTVTFQMIGESSDSYIPDHVLYFAVQPLTLFHADVSNPANIRVLKKYWLNELMEYINSFSPYASFICTVPSELLKAKTS